MGRAPLRPAPYVSFFQRHSGQRRQCARHFLCSPSSGWKLVPNAGESRRNQCARGARSFSRLQEQRIFFRPCHVCHLRQRAVCLEERRKKQSCRSRWSSDRYNGRRRPPSYFRSAQSIRDGPAWQGGRDGSMKSLWAVLALAVLSPAQTPPPERRVAITIDDGPVVNELKDLANFQKISAGLIGSLESEKVPATIFINERQLNVRGQRDGRAAV